MSLSPIEVRIRIRPTSNKEHAQVVVLVDDSCKDAWLVSCLLPSAEATQLARHMQKAEWYYEEESDGPFGWTPEDIPVPPPEDEDEPLVPVE